MCLICICICTVNFYFYCICVCLIVNSCNVYDLPEISPCFNYVMIYLNREEEEATETQ